jgi:uncharacterized protein YqeY
MDTKEKLEIALKNAMKAGDEITKRTVRMSLAAIRQVEIDKQIKLDEVTALGIIQKELKTRRESVEEASRANRADIVASTQAEIKVLEGFLPAALSVEDLQALVEAAITDVGASGPADMGKVMKVLMPRIAGRAAGDQVSAAVRNSLQK